jgi:hypothetical protein
MRRHGQTHAKNHQTTPSGQAVEGMAQPLTNTFAHCKTHLFALYYPSLNVDNQLVNYFSNRKLRVKLMIFKADFTWVGKIR